MSSVIYRNADTYKLDVLKDNNNKTGIYKWTNKLTGKFYSLGYRFKKQV